jgi:C-methyltransferase
MATTHEARHTADRKPRAARVPPAQVARAATGLSEAVQALGRRMTPAPATLMTMTVGYQVTSRAISTAAELDIADHLADTTCTIRELATATGTDADALARLIRLLEAAGLLSTDRHGRIGLTRLGQPLRSDHPQSLRDWCRYLGADWHWELWADLAGAVRDGRTAYGRRFDAGFFE